jgi:hypothetical protein
MEDNTHVLTYSDSVAYYISFRIAPFAVHSDEENITAAESGDLPERPTHVQTLGGTESTQKEANDLEAWSDPGSWIELELHWSSYITLKQPETVSIMSKAALNATQDAVSDVISLFGTSQTNRALDYANIHTDFIRSKPLYAHNDVPLIILYTIRAQAHVLRFSV